MVLCAKLGSKASAHVMQMFGSGRPTLEMAVRALKRFFAPMVSEETARTQFHSRNQLRAETLVEFHGRFGSW